MFNGEQYFEVDPLTAPIVRDVYQKYADGATMKQLTEWLYERGIRSQKGKPVKLDAVKHMLKNRRYIGEYRYRDIAQPDAIPRIVEDDLFEKVQVRIEKNKKAPARYKTKEEGGYLLTTKLFCGHCGAYMAGESGTSRNGNTYHYYKCVTAKNKHTCKKKSVRKAWIENLVLQNTTHMLIDDSVMERVTSMVLDLQKKENTILPRLKKQLVQAEKNISNILDAIKKSSKSFVIPQLANNAVVIDLWHLSLFSCIYRLYCFFKSTSQIAFSSRLSTLLSTLKSALELLIL